MDAKDKINLVIQKIKKIWEDLDGKKTYVTALVLLTMQVIKFFFPNAIPEELYKTLEYYIELALYGSASHGALKIITHKNKPK